MTDFEKEMMSLYEWLMRRTTKVDGKFKTNTTAVKYFLKDFKDTVEKYKEGN